MGSIFFGKLRDIEVEHLYDKSWFAVTETCLAMTIFRDEFTAQILALFAILLAAKMFHWLTQDRVEYVSDPKPEPATLLPALSRGLLPSRARAPVHTTHA